VHLLNLVTQSLPPFESEKRKRKRKYRLTKLRPLTMKELFNRYISKNKTKIWSFILATMDKHCGNMKYQRFIHLKKKN